MDRRDDVPDGRTAREDREGCGSPHLGKEGSKKRKESQWHTAKRGDWGVRQTEFGSQRHHFLTV